MKGKATTATITNGIGNIHKNSRRGIPQDAPSAGFFALMQLLSLQNRI